jgi:hypothetical protein
VLPRKVHGIARAACGCRELGHVMRPAHTHERGRRADPVAVAERSRRSAGECDLRRVLVERSVRVVSVEMVDVLAQHCGEVPWSGDQEAVEAFAPKSADPAFRDRVRSRRSERVYG